MTDTPVSLLPLSRRSLNIALLCATGSIGKSTLEVIALHSEYRVFALTANQNVELMLAQCLRFSPRFAVMVDEDAAERLAQMLRSRDSATEVLAGPDALVTVASHPDVDTVMAAIVGAAGLPSALAAV